VVHATAIPPTSFTSSKYPINKTKYIAGFDKAPDSLKAVLVTTYFDTAEKSCLANDKTNKDVPDDMYYITVRKVEGNAAIANFCPSTHSVTLTLSDGAWKIDC
jgi:hypothetical protein